MAIDLVDRSQVLVRRAAEQLRRRGAMPKEAVPRRCVEGSARERIFERGEEQVASLVEVLEDFTGASVAGRRALDFGCGFGRLALPLAQRCEHVYGLDISPEVLAEGERNAARMGIENVEWLQTGRLDELSGRYDMVVSHWVFQHIPSREGERIFAALVHGLRPGGIGAIHVTVRPRRPLRGLLRGGRLDWTYGYTLMNSYSLTRLGALLAEAGIERWLVKWHARLTPDATQKLYPSVTIFFAKD
jgi:2-polyprenyl-3-methyl-5-hydroxy-6-metoxy-1,4-benzoquinol methylase